jgi:hypothetical protein
MNTDNKHIKYLMSSGEWYQADIKLLEQGLYYPKFLYKLLEYIAL